MQDPVVIRVKAKFTRNKMEFMAINMFHICAVMAY